MMIVDDSSAENPVSAPDDLELEVVEVVDGTEAVDAADAVGIGGGGGGYPGQFPRLALHK